MAWWSPGSGSWRERWVTAAVVTTVFDRWGRYTPLACQCHDTSVECRTLDSTPGNFPRPCRLILPNSLLQHTWHRYDFNISPLTGSEKSWHRQQGTKHIWRLPLWNCNSNIFAVNFGLHSLKGMSGPFGDSSIVCVNLSVSHLNTEPRRTTQTWTHPRKSEVCVCIGFFFAK